MIWARIAPFLSKTIAAVSNPVVSLLPNPQLKLQHKSAVPQRLQHYFFRTEASQLRPGPALSLCARLCEAHGVRPACRRFEARTRGRTQVRLEAMKTLHDLLAHKLQRDSTQLQIPFENID